MKAKSDSNPGDPLGWAYQAGIHGIWNSDYNQPDLLTGNNYQDFVDFAVENGFDTRENILNGKSVLNNCTHFANVWNGMGGSVIPQQVAIADASPANFLAWHRLYLQYFEEIARENLRLSGDPDAETWALPYWAYLNEDQGVMPEPLRDPESSLYTPYRNPSLNGGAPLNSITLPPWPNPAKWSEEALLGLGETGYMAMGSKIEILPHNAFHNFAGVNGGLFEGFEGTQGLMMPLQSAAFDPLFWLHHSFIDKIWSAYNRTNNAYYAFEYEFDQNPWNYAFLTPSDDGSLQKDVVSSWGDNSKGVISKIYNPDYSYDYFGTLSNPVEDPGPNKVLSILQSPAFRPIVSEISWGEAASIISGVLQDNTEAVFYQTAVPLVINEKQLTYEAYRQFTEKDKQLKMDANINYFLPQSPAYCKFLVTTKDLAGNINFVNDVVNSRYFRSRGLFVQDMPMGEMSSPMAKTSTMDLAYERYSYFSGSVDDSDEIVLLMISNSADTYVESMSLGLSQNLNKNSTQDSNFDAAAYFSRSPELLLNPEATADPEGYYKANDQPHGVVAPEINFRAAALGVAYLSENPDLIATLDSSSPYEAVADYLDSGLAAGRSLGDAALRSSLNYLRQGGASDAVILDLTLLPSFGEAVADVVVAREAAFDSTLGFYRVVDDLGTVEVGGVSYQPGHALYARMATSDANRFDPLTGFSVSQDVAERRSGIGLSQDSGKLAPFVVVNQHAFFTFAEANSDGINHFRALAPNILGFEDLYGGGDTDFDDMLLSFRIAPPATGLA